MNIRAIRVFLVCLLYDICYTSSQQRKYTLDTSDNDRGGLIGTKDVNLSWIDNRVDTNQTSADVATWTSIRSDKLHEWYDPVDICILEKFPPKNYDVENMKWTDLEKKYFHLLKDTCHGKDSVLHGDAAPGRAFFSPDYRFSLCPALEDPSSHYMKVVEGLKPRGNILIKLLETMHETKRSLIFLGDSITFQNYEAFLMGVKKESDRPEGKAYNVKIHRWLTPSDVPHQLNFSVFDPNHNQSAKSDKYGGGAMVTISNVKHMVFFVRFYKIKFWSIDNYIHWIKLVDNIIKYANLPDPFSKWGAVIVANAGLHINEFKEAAREFEDLMGILEELHATSRNNVRVFWRETSSTHFPGKRNGYYNLSGSSANDSCVAFNVSYPVDPEHPEDAIDWRNDLARTVYMRNSYSFGVIPFARLTRPLHDMHIGMQRFADSFTLDCAHFCWFPQLWQPVWEVLYDALVKKTR